MLSWNKRNETKDHGISSHYFLKIRQNNEEFNMTIQNEEMKLSNLTTCSEYCFRLSGVNEAGSSEFSRELCSHTLASSKIE